MLIDQIRSAQAGNQDEMLFLIRKFSGLLKKYGRKLRYEDAEYDLTADLIELVRTCQFEKLNNSSDGAIVNFLARSVYRFYLKRLQVLLEKTPSEVAIEDLTPAQKDHLSAQIAVENETSISFLIPESQLTQKEIYVLTAVYEKGYSVSKLAEILQVSRQNVNQIKKRAEKKLREKLS